MSGSQCSLSLSVVPLFTSATPSPTLTTPLIRSPTLLSHGQHVFDLGAWLVRMCVPYVCIDCNIKKKARTSEAMRSPMSDLQNLLSPIDEGQAQCVDVCAEMCVGMCADMCEHMWIDLCIHLCVDICVSMCADMCEDMCVDLCIDMSP